MTYTSRTFLEFELEKLKNMSFDIRVFSSYLISISLAVVLGIGSRRPCLLIHDFYDYRGYLEENSGEMLEYQYDKSYTPNWY